MNEVIDFWAPWCGPCKRLAPVIDELANEYGGTVKFKKVNLDENADLGNEHGVASLPTLIFLRNGREVGRVSGFSNKEKLKKQIDSAFGR